MQFVSGTPHKLSSRCAAANHPDPKHVLLLAESSKVVIAALGESRGYDGEN